MLIPKLFSKFENMNMSQRQKLYSWRRAEKCENKHGINWLANSIRKQFPGQQRNKKLSFSLKELVKQDAERTLNRCIIQNPMQYNFVFVLAFVSNLIKLVFKCICKFHGFSLRVEVSRLLVTSLLWFIGLNLKSFWQNPPQKVEELDCF